MAAATRPRANHIELAQRILELARERGMRPGARLPEERLGALCNVSRTPIRAALRILLDRGDVAHDDGDGYRLVADPEAMAGTATLPSAAEDELAEAVLRDRAARRLDDAVTVGALMKRYGTDRRTVLASLKRLAEDNLVERAPGQSWLFRPSVDGPDAAAESYAFRLLLEPAALATAGFRLDAGAAGRLRREMEALLALSDAGFDQRAFRATDETFHGLVAQGAANRFVAEALGAHLRLRRLPGTIVGVNVYRLRQSTREHLAILDQLEARQFDAAADLMRLHLRLSRNQRPQAANRGAPALYGSMVRRPA
jgi:DNA-binding GntR family transcriptional regulator